MRKYFTIFLLAWQSGLVYRTGLIMWRFRQMLSTLMAITIWTVVFNNQTAAFGYDRLQMINYILIVAVLQSVILATTLNGLATEIYSGHMNQHFLKPQKIFLSLAANETADKARNFMFSLLEVSVLMFIFQPSISWPSLGQGLLFLLWVMGGIALNFYIAILFGCLGFWSPDTWGPKFIFFMIVEFTAGKIFPLDILPAPLQAVLYFTPFPYLSFAQVQLFLGRLDFSQITFFSTILLFWIITSWWLAQHFWNKGVKGYEALGQ